MLYMYMRIYPYIYSFFTHYERLKKINLQAYKILSPFVYQSIYHPQSVIIVLLACLHLMYVVCCTHHHVHHHHHHQTNHQQWSKRIVIYNHSQLLCQMVYSGLDSDSALFVATLSCCQLRMM